MKNTWRTLGWGLILAGLFLALTTWRLGHIPLAHGGGPITLLTAPPQTSFAPEEQRMIDIYARVRPSVVNITSQIIQFDFLFGPVPESGQGSGFIINRDGYILTNFHVIQGARQLTVTWTPATSQSHTYNATVVGTAQALDLAVIKIPATDLPPVTLGDSSRLQVGQQVEAIGNPFGLPGTMTHGIISSIRTVQEGDANVDIESAIQTDAPINPGNSGGPLLNSQGSVIGINTMILSETGSNVGIGFAIPINEAKAVLNQLVTTGHVEGVKLGVESLPLSADLAQQLGLPVNHGLLVISVDPGSLAARAGLRGGTEPGYIGNMPVRFGGDIITAFNGEPLQSSSQLTSLLLTQPPDSTVTLTVQRGDRQLQVPISLAHP